jgi:hypothetical protein
MTFAMIKTTDQTSVIASIIGGIETIKDRMQKIERLFYEFFTAISAGAFFADVSNHSIPHPQS